MYSNLLRMQGHSRLAPTEYQSRSMSPTFVQPAQNYIEQSNKTLVQLHFAPGSPERQRLSAALEDLKARLPVQVPAIGGLHATVDTSADLTSLSQPHEHASTFQQFASASKEDVKRAIETALTAKREWQDMPFTDRASIFLRAADLVSGKYRFELLAATMLGQGKNAWQAEIDAAAELADFFRYNVSFAQEIYDKQPTVNARSHYGRTDWRPLEGFVYSVSPFNFTAIGGNLVSAPALMGNVVVWKPAPMTAYQSWLVHKILLEAGLPEGVVQLVNGDAELITGVIFDHPEFAALSFIGSSDVFRTLNVKAAQGLAEKRYRDFPRLAGETSGKNFHLIGPSTDVPNAARHTVRAAYEYAGQKCSACSRIYVPKSQAELFFSEMRKELARVKVGPPEEYTSFTGPVIDKKAFERISSAIDSANKDPKVETVVGGTYDDSVGYYVNPTLYNVSDPNHWLFDKELFGPVLAVYVYPDNKFSETLSHIDSHGGGFALTGNIFSNDQKAIREAENRLRYAAGNFYVNCKITAAVIGQQSFGGARASGTCDKAGSSGLLMRFVAPRTLKEEFNKLDEVMYPSNMEEGAM
ncbi:MAG: Delta-1-pyrroline-5-carboxylate dehydrogenase, mitochondrial [Bathelium mastoideum]|nr:MAG: Delta-1-pyrroline-5-carboxylate dehydrogenase, mitochondrial [Bathelium mastoideum]